MPQIRDVDAYAKRVIAQLTGTVAHLGGNRVVLTVSGVGYEVLITPAHALELRLEAEVTLITALVVREDALTLYGFRNAAEREVFEQLNSVSGVGPKLAMGVLAALEPARLAAAVEAEDVAAFKQVSGVGPKTAKLIIVQLKGKLAAHEEAAAASVGTATRGMHEDVIEALVGLGTPAKQAQQAVERAAQNQQAAAADMPTLLRAALRELGGAR